jgi:hypothetical protein
MAAKEISTDAARVQRRGSILQAAEGVVVMPLHL